MGDREQRDDRRYERELGESSLSHVMVPML
jgi:hypothetical protein